MNMFDTFIEKAKDVCDIATKKTGEMVEVSKIKFECVKVNGEIKKLYEQLGSTVYSMVKSNYENKDVIDGLVEEIDDNLEKLNNLNQKLSDLKNVVTCKVCNSKNPEENYFCAKCGSRIKSEFNDYTETEHGPDTFAVLTDEEAQL